MGATLLPTKWELKVTILVLLEAVLQLKNRGNFFVDFFVTILVLLEAVLQWLRIKPLSLLLTVTILVLLEAVLQS